VGTLIGLVGRRVRRLGWSDHRGHRRAGAARPDQDAPVLIHRQFFGIDQVLFEVFQRLVIELQPPFQHPIREALFPLEEPDNLIEDGIVVHHLPSTWASVASACGSQKVMSMARYRSMAADSSARACSR
jgi:hypothetical protein